MAVGRADITVNDAERDQPVEAAVVARWYALGYDEAIGTVTVDAMALCRASTQELLAYWWGARDARSGQPRQALLD
jgi:hypothetical protein